MSSSFGGIEMGKSALNAFRLGMQTVGHNISNMNTEGYSRQRVNFKTVTPENIPGVGQLGQGMTASTIERIRDEFLDFQYRDVQSTLGYWDKVNDLYESIQNYISEPNSSGIRSAMDTFFTNMQTLQEKPEDTSARQALVTSANSLGSMLGNLISSFNTYNESVNLEIKQAVDDVNGMLHNLAALNKEIAEAEALNQNANDLRDSRDLILDKLSKMMDISYNEPLEHDGVKGEFFLSVNGRVLVQGINVRELKAHAFLWDNQVYYDVQVAENEFDIVEDPTIAEALATGAEGSYQLSVDRIANGAEWSIGGGNAHCLETYAVRSSGFEDNIYAGGGDDDLMTFKVTTQAFSTGNVLDDSSAGSNTIAIARVDVNGNRLEDMRITMTRIQDPTDPTHDIWQLDDGNGNITTTSYAVSGSSLTTTDLVNYINSIPGTGISAAVVNSAIEITPTNTPESVKVVCSNEILGTLSEEKGPGVAGTFDVIIGNSGNQAESAKFATGTITGTSGNDTFRISLSGPDACTEVNISVQASAGGFTLSSDLGNSTTVTALTIDNFASFLNSTFSSASTGTGLANIHARAFDSDVPPDGINDKIELKAAEDCIFSMLDINGSLASAMGLASTVTTQTITVANTDTIDDIAAMFSSPLSASVSKGYLTVTAGNDEVITFTGNSDLLRRLAFTKEESLASGTTRTISNVNERGTILDSDSQDIPYKLQFRSIDDNETPSILTVKIDRVTNGWKLRAELDGVELKDSDGNSVYTPVFVNSDDLTTADIEKFVNEAVEIANNLNPSIGGTVLTSKTLNLNARDDNGRLNFWTDNRKQLEVTDYSGMLGALTEATQELLDVNMRVEPANINDPLNISGSFRIQVGTQGTRVTSNNFAGSAGFSLNEGEILAAIKNGDTTSPRKHTFRVGVSGDQADISATWNASTGKWVLSSDLGMSKETDAALTMEDLTNFISSVFTKAGGSDNPSLSAMRVVSGKSPSGTVTQFYIESKDNHLISISDVEGNLASSMGIANDNPVITIDVESSDSLVTIRNKINEKYQAEFGLTQPEQWVHASTDNGYLEIFANVAGEAQRITLMGSEDGNMQVLRRLGLTRNQAIISDVLDDNGNPLTSYREVAYIPPSGVSTDASFTLNGVHYLSSDNMFNMARRIPSTSGDIRERYKAEALTEVNPGMWLNLKNTGTTTIRVYHHVRDGSIKGLEEARDEMIPNLKSELDEMAYGLIKNINAFQYSGYGVAADENMSGVAFFNALGFKSHASQNLSVTERVAYDPSLIGAAMGKRDDNGLAVYGKSGGSGDGTNASRMVSLNFDKVLENGTMTIGGIYDAMLSQIGTEAGHAKLMYTTEATVSDQINSQRQACSGVNLDEELMDIVILNRAFGAMSRYITALDEMLNTVINGMGLVGR